jgi:hypothetical protein
MRYAIAAGFLLLFALSSWLWVKNSRLQSQLRLAREAGGISQQAGQRSTSIVDGQRQEKTAAEEAKTGSPSGDRQRLPLQASEQMPRIEHFAPEPVTRQRARPSVLKIASQQTLVELELQLQRNPYPLYAVALQTADGKQVLNINGVSSVRNRLGGQSILLPMAGMLQARDYVIEVSGITSGGQLEGIEAYSFRVAIK